MLTKFRVENFKSIESLELELGRVNVFIGENGSGKSNILEAVALASAALQNKLDHEFLAPRGIRVTSPELMRSGFEKEKEAEDVRLQIELQEVGGLQLLLRNENKRYSPWRFAVNAGPEEEGLYESIRKFANSSGAGIEISTYLERFIGHCSATFGNFVIFTPENSTLRTLETESQIVPLGKNGEGLFALLQYFAEEPNQPAIRELNQQLQLFGWFDSFALPERLWPGESFLKIKDKYLDANIEFIDQRSANEGFLFVLFYLSLFISKDTPKFFAIDNIETSLNPKLCTKLMLTLTELAKAHDKQVMITTHSPAVLDGLNLNDDEQRLFRVYRNAHGRTVVSRVSKPQPLPGQEPSKLSELFMMGHLGAMPKNFSL